MKILPLGCTQTNWIDFIALTTEVVGRSPMRSLDAANVKPGDPFSFIAALGELSSEGISPREAVWYAGAFLEHVSVSFIIHCSNRELYHINNLPLLKMSLIEGKFVTRGEDQWIMLLSGTLFDWKCVVPAMLVDATDALKRELFNAVFIWFKKMNLRELFSDFTEVQCSREGGFNLERKR
jgi:hypothetical protein